MNRSHPFARSSLLAAALAAAAVPVLAQTTPPNAGETLRELRQQPPASPARNTTRLVVPADADVAADSSQRFPVRAVRIEGNKAIATADLEPLVAGVVGRDATLGELRQAASRITALYRERGFVVARGFVPAQEIEDGTVRFSVLEGSLNSSTVLNTSIVRTDRLEAIVAAQKLDGRVIVSSETDRELLLLADLPAVGKVSGNLKPGREVGTSDMFVSVDAGKPYEGEVSVDTYGNRYTGQSRLNGHVEVNSPLKIGDRLGVRATVTEEKLLYGRIAYDLPANNDGLRAGAAVSSSSYELGKEFAGLDARGTANTAGLTSSYPLVRGLNTNVWLAGALDYRKLTDEVRSTGTETKKSATALTLEAYGDWADSLGGGAYSTWHLTGNLGRLKIDTPAAEVADAAGPQAAGRYVKLGLVASRLQAITPLTSAFVSISGQVANKNLDSSEKFVIGGIYGVRAYPQGEGAGDEGVLASAELRQDLTAGVQASAFYDFGRVRFNHETYTTTPNLITLKGFGVGLGGRYREVVVKATVAWRNGQAAVSAPDRRPRAWLMAGWSF